ncbi:hypothetical protein Ancab_000661 [Ancistrocladus abbreviatus]
MRGQSCRKSTEAAGRSQIQNRRSLMMTTQVSRMIFGRAANRKETLEIRRRETKGKSDFPLLKYSSALMQKGGSDKIEEDSPGSTNCGPLPYLDWNEPMVFISSETIPFPNNALAKSSVGLQPNILGAKRSKLKGLKKKSKKKGSCLQQPVVLNINDVKKFSPEGMEELEISIRFLYDSNIANLNRIFLNNFNQIMAEEMWEIGKWLGVQSAEDDRTMIQQITELKD